MVMNMLHVIICSFNAVALNMAASDTGVEMREYCTIRNTVRMNGLVV